MGTVHSPVGAGLRWCLRCARIVAAAAMLAGTLALAGCETDGTDVSARALKPLSPAMVAELESRNMAKDSPMVVRLFKEESELEVWKQDRSGRFALLKTYPICRWSGELGPKTREGDRQAPEGFYTITPGQMNPNSHYYLSFDIGYPNAFDRAYGRTGSNLMVHGDCSSRGCYAMTDEQISEIYALARESFFGGQRSFQVQAYPFRMTALNMARHRDNPNMPFWRMLKQGNDHFLVSGLEPKVDVCEKRYIFDAEPVADAASVPPHFNPTGRCPAYRVRDDLASAVKQKQHQDEVQTAELISRGTATVAVRTGTDGGTHPAFLAVYEPQQIRNPDGTVRTVVTKRAPSLFPLHVNLPGDTDAATPPTVATTAASAAAPTASASSEAAGTASGPASASPPARPAANRDQAGGGNVVTRLFRAIGHGGTKPEATTEPSTASVAKPAAKTTPHQVAGAAKLRSEPNSGPDPEAAPFPPVQAEPQQAQVPAAPAPAAPTTGEATTGLITGAQPVVPAGNFESRWSALR
jgi:murein L,D-transpeptidase YafK